MAVDPFNVCVCLEASLHVRGCFNLCTPLSARISAPPPVSVCVSSPVVASSGPHNPQERAASFFTVTGSSPRRVARGLQTNSVSMLFFFIFASTDHGPCRSPDREMSWQRGPHFHFVCWDEGRGRNTGMLKRNLIGVFACTDQSLTRLLRSVS